MNTQKEKKGCVYVEAEGVCDLVSTTGLLIIAAPFPFTTRYIQQWLWQFGSYKAFTSRS